MYIFVYGLVIDGPNTKNIIYIIILFVISIVGIYSQWTEGIFINKEKNILVFSLFLGRYRSVKLAISDIESIELKKDKLRFKFLVKFKNGEHRELYYSYYEKHLIPKIGFKRIKKQLIKLNEILSNN